jgi:ATP-dependent exoDNAse (exonuclease V) beta subunit
VASNFGAEGVANCLCFLEFLESIETGTPEETLVRLDCSLDSLYSPEFPDETARRVDLMTVHGAKGLEFDVVFLPFLDWRPLAAGKPPPYLLEPSPEGSSMPLIAMGPDRRLTGCDPAYRAVKRLHDGRRLAELKRVLYVAMTRARKHLFLSGLAQDTQQGPKAPKDSALAWILSHTVKHPHSPIPTFLNPPGPEASLEKDKRVFSMPNPMPFEPQPLPYVVDTPSDLAERTLGSNETGNGDGDGYYARIRGTVTHRLVGWLWSKGKLPATQRIATALAAEGMNPDRAATVALEIETELRACQDEAFFKWLLEHPHPSGKSEWPVEAMKQPGVIQSGVLDFVRQEGDRWWIIDFKTSRPKAKEEQAHFLKREADRYRLQLMAYQDMLAKAKGIDPSQVRVGLYFTAIQRWYAFT